MTIRTKLLLATSASVAFFAAAVSPAVAQPLNDPFAIKGTSKEWAVTLGAGGALRPTYEGSDSYVVMPLPLVRVVWRDMITFDPFGLSAYWRFDALQVGGGLTYNMGRTQNAGLFTPGNWRLNGLGDIPSALGFRGFVNYKLGPAILGSTLTKYVAEGNSGLLMNASIGVPWRIDDRFMVLGRAFTTLADTTYMQTYFGINGTQSINSGYQVYGAGGGIKNVGLELRANYRFATNWEFSASTQVSQLVGYAAGSPISVSDTAVTLITTIGYRF